MKYNNLDLGTIEAVFNKLGGIEGAKKFLRGEREVVTTKHIIDCDSQPSVPQGWSIEEHRSVGKFEWSPEKVSLYLSEYQKNSDISGHDLRKELADKPVLNACVLDYLLDNTHLIPEEWKGKIIFFWGTIYRHLNGELCVRYLYRYIEGAEEGFDDNDYPLDNDDWSDNDHAVCLQVGR